MTKFSVLLTIATCILVTGCASDHKYPKGSLGAEAAHAFMEGFLRDVPSPRRVIEEAGRAAAE